MNKTEVKFKVQQPIVSGEKDVEGTNQHLQEQNIVGHENVYAPIAVNTSSVSALTQYKKHNLIGAHSTLSTFGSTEQLKNLSLSKIYESKRVRDVEMMQLHTRI